METKKFISNYSGQLVFSAGGKNINVSKGQEFEAPENKYVLSLVRKGDVAPIDKKKKDKSGSDKPNNE